MVREERGSSTHNMPVILHVLTDFLYENICIHIIYIDIQETSCIVQTYVKKIRKFHWLQNLRFRFQMQGNGLFITNQSAYTQIGRNRIENQGVFCKNSTKWTFLFIYIHVKFSENQQFWELSVSFFKLLQTDICSDPHELVIELEWILARNIFRGTENESKKVHFKNPNKSCYNSSTFLQYTSLNIHNSTNNKCLQDF